MNTIAVIHGNITLIPLQESHEQTYIQLSMIPEIINRMNRPASSSKDFCELLASVQKQPDFYIWMIEYKCQIVGSITAASLKKSSRIFQGGYWIDPVFWKKGIASDALAKVIDFLFDNTEAERLQAIVEPDNISSIRVLEKNGYECEGLLRKFHPGHTGTLLDVYMYALIK
jgi:RimJ/RimL family protein N-acetyltransferase